MNQHKKINASWLNVLIACEESQVTVKAFRNLGFNAFSCDIQRPSGNHEEWHYLGDVKDILDAPCKFKTLDGRKHQIKKWHLLIAHPPCTYLTKAGACRMFKNKTLQKQRYKEMLKARDFFFRFYNASVECIAIENPIPMKICKLPPISTYVQPYWFGEPYSKKTCFWLKNLPPLFPTVFAGEWQPFIHHGKRKEGYKRKCANGAKKRSKTFVGVANALAKQYGEYIQEYYQNRKGIPESGNI